MQNTNHNHFDGDYLFQGFRLDIGGHCLYGPDGKVRTLSGRALDILQLLIENRGHPLTKSFLLEQVWPDNVVEENNLNQAITSIRKVLGDSKNESRFIKTLTGKGYCFVAELDELPEQSSNNQKTTREQIPVPEIATQFAINRVINRIQFPFSAPAFLLMALSIISIGIYLFLQEKAPSVAENTATLTVSQAEFFAQENYEALSGSIAVMPFTDLSPESINRNDIFTLGLHDELINQLSQLKSLQLVSRESVLSPSIRQLPLNEIGRILRVESIITGSIMVSSAQARITLQLLDPNTGVIKWAFDHSIDTDSLEDMITTQRDIALKVTQALQSDTTQISLQSLLATPTDSFEAYRYNMASRRAYYNQDFENSLTLSKQALSLDPEYPGALYNFSRANYYLSSSPLPGMTTRDHLREGLESAQRLIDLAPDKHEGYVLKAMALASTGRWKDAMDEVKRLEKIDAPLWDLQILAPLLMSLGEYQSTINILEANLKIEPLNSFGRGFLMAGYEVVGNRLQARLEYEIGNNLTPDWWGDTVNIFLTLGRGKLSTDLNELQSEELRNLLTTYSKGNHAATLSLLNTAFSQNNRSSAILVHYAAIAASIGEQDLAIQFMIRATTKLPVHIHWIWLPVFEETWNHPNFKNLLESAGVLSYWQEYGQPEICHSSYKNLICDNEKAIRN